MRKLIENGIITLGFVMTEKNLADSLTNELLKKLVQNTPREM